MSESPQGSAKDAVREVYRWIDFALSSDMPTEKILAELAQRGLDPKVAGEMITEVKRARAREGSPLGGLRRRLGSS